jgi:hypothetical protein
MRGIQSAHLIFGKSINPRRTYQAIFSKVLSDNPCLFGNGFRIVPDRVHRHKQRELLMGVTSDKPFHKPAVAPFVKEGFLATVWQETRLPGDTLAFFQRILMRSVFIRSVPSRCLSPAPLLTAWRCSFKLPTAFFRTLQPSGLEPNPL